jgi:A/G-specific adenine glycosylase
VKTRLSVSAPVETLASSKIQSFRHKLSYWGQQNLRDFPWRRTTNAYDIFIAEFMLQKTDANTVAPIYQTFLSRYPTLSELAIASVEEIAEIIKPQSDSCKRHKSC